MSGWIVGPIIFICGLAVGMAWAVSMTVRRTEAFVRNMELDCELALSRNDDERWNQRYQRRETQLVGIFMLQNWLKGESVRFYHQHEADPD